MTGNKKPISTEKLHVTIGLDNSYRMCALPLLKY